ncbi:PREDICTED: LDLR chaperone boca [Dufourea novaeangliae]|uniref:LDLR chaperone boca n=1 Tax=Dufourea novaeangliae TaxID=178035 RepID=A0A154PT37_DUFNO|nr:PREDICTED: LDLR chaperone boca [Dufourea novaeangliae]KZC15075.1 LDLR chaperone boca [Dufourea novaeangliae]
MREIIIFGIFLLFYVEIANNAKSGKTKSWKDKDIRDMTDADLEHLLDQWEENDEPLEPDELPEHLRPSPKIDISKLDMSNPDNVLKMTKRGKGVMMFVDTNEDLSADAADVIMKIWQTSLQNNHIIAERYPTDPKRSVFLFREGSQAVDAKNFLLQQPELSHVILEGQTYYRDPRKQSATMEKQKKNDENMVNEKTKKVEL